MVELSNLVDVKPYCLKTFVWDILRFLRILSIGWQLHLDAGCCRGLYRFTQLFSNYRWLQRCVREWASVPLLFRVFVPWTWFILLLQCRSEGMFFYPAVLSWLCILKWSENDYFVMMSVLEFVMKQHHDHFACIVVSYIGVLACPVSNFVLVRMEQCRREGYIMRRTFPKCYLVVMLIWSCQCLGAKALFLARRCGVGVCDSHPWNNSPKNKCRNWIATWIANYHKIG